MVRQHGILTDSLGEMVGNPLGETAGVDKDECRPVCHDELGDPIVDLPPHLVGRHDAQVLFRNLDRQVELPAVTRIDDHRLGGSARQERRYLVDGIDGRGQSDPLGTSPTRFLDEIVETG